MYWWRIIHSMKVEYDNAKAKGDDTPSQANKGPVKRDRNSPRKMPKLPSQQGR